MKQKNKSSREIIFVMILVLTLFFLIAFFIVSENNHKRETAKCWDIGKSNNYTYSNEAEHLIKEKLFIKSKEEREFCLSQIK